MEYYNVIITSRAQIDLTVCIAFVLNTSVEAAKNLANEMKESLQSLSTWPERNPIFEMPKGFPFDIRKQVISKKYVVLYSIEDKNVVVYRILDSRRGFDHIFF